jgi:hypothetical protein
MPLSNIPMGFEFILIIFTKFKISCNLYKPFFIYNL